MTTDIHEPTSQSGKTEQPQTTGQPNPPAKPSLFSLVLKHWRLVGVLLLLLMLVGTYCWKTIAVARAKAQLSRQAAVVITAQSESYLRLMAIPLVWTVRSEMLRGNYEQVNQYLTQFVKEPNMKELLVARTDGSIVAATNKQREGTSITALFPPEIVQVNAITVTTGQDDTWLVSAPIMGLNDKLGVLVLVAAVPAYSLEAPSR